MATQVPQTGGQAGWTLDAEAGAVSAVSLPGSAPWAGQGTAGTAPAPAGLAPPPAPLQLPRNPEPLNFPPPQD